jgi:radical SAM peptide maturase (CXXX-repeat target family)
MTVANTATLLLQILARYEKDILDPSTIEKEEDYVIDKAYSKEFYYAIFDIVSNYYREDISPSEIIVINAGFDDNKGLMLLSFTDMGADGNDLDIDDQYIIDKDPSLFKFDQIDQASYTDEIAATYSDYFTPGSSARSFTFQVTENCNLRCKYCQPAGTKIIMSDLSTKNVEDIVVGDKVLSFDEYTTPNEQRHLTESIVTWITKHDADEIVEISSPDLKDPLRLTLDHPVLTARNVWKPAGKIRPSDGLTIFTALDDIDIPIIDYDSSEYKVGYFVSAWHGDGCIKEYMRTSENNKYFMRFVVKDDECMKYMQTLADEFKVSHNIQFHNADFKISSKYNITRPSIQSQKKADYEILTKVIRSSMYDPSADYTDEYLAGFVAGIYDTEGSFDGKTVRVSNSDTLVHYILEQFMKRFGFNWTYDNIAHGVNKPILVIRLLGGAPENYRFGRIINSKIKRKSPTNIIGRALLTSTHEYTIKHIKTPVTVYNFECTENHTYIANNVCVHNCYQCSKSTKIMKFEDAKKCIDDLLAGKYDYMNPGFAKAIVLEFIGGEPLLEIELIQRIYEYFLQECYRLDHPWLMFHRLSMCSNGLLYFNRLSQEFLEKYSSSVSFNISIDGNKKLHDSARVQPSEEGSYDIGIAGVKDYTERLGMRHSSKMTLAPSNIEYIYDSIVSLVEEHNYMCISLNVVFEEGWTNEDARKIYTELKRVGDFLVDTDRPYVGLSIYHKYPTLYDDKYEDMRNVCGGNGAMLALNSDGDFYPCIRYMESSLKDDQIPITMGKLSEDMRMSDKEKQILSEMDNLTSMSQQTDRCLSCGINSRCNFCSGYNYQRTGTVNRRVTYICEPKMAEHLASIYYWGRLSEKYPKYNIEKIPMLLPEELATTIVSPEEYNMLLGYASNFNKA